LDAETWSEVQPGAAGVAETALPAPERGVIVLGNYQATMGSYQRILSGEIRGLPTTWRNLGLLLAAVPPRDVFLTNAYIGFPEAGSDIDSFRTTPEYTQRCQRLLAQTITLMEPRCIVCMGTPAARFVARMVPDLHAWSPWPGLSRLDANANRIVRDCKVGDLAVTLVAVAHPSSRISNTQRLREAALVADACGL
jgi:uracil-DNA glycosylase